ncbi:MAG: Rrf2 family transcriptional regulator [bacterium]
MLSLRKETDYAIQFIQFLVDNKDQCSALKTFAKQSGISFFFMQKIARKLNRAGIIEAEQGMCGGYRLKIKPDKLDLHQIVEIMEEGISLTKCIKNLSCGCNKGVKKCKVKDIMNKLNKEIVKAMKKIKLN